MLYIRGVTKLLKEYPSSTRNEIPVAGSAVNTFNITTVNFPPSENGSS